MPAAIINICAAATRSPLVPSLLGVQLLALTGDRSGAALSCVVDTTGAAILTLLPGGTWWWL
jgi:hypothetical protein